MFITILLNKKNSLTIYSLIGPCARVRKEGHFLILIHKFDVTVINLSIESENLVNSVYKTHYVDFCCN